MRILLSLALFTLLASCGAHDNQTNLSASRSSSKVNLSFTEINLAWFGLNGDLKNKLGSETRVATVRSFLQTNKLLTDVMVFAEIVDIPLLEKKVLGNQYQCQSYKNSNPKHQYVVICHTRDYRLDIADDADNYALDSLNLDGRLRPAVHGILKNKEGKRMAHIFGVHLKANPNKSDVRMEQVQNLVQYLHEETDNDPVVVMGDFNTFDSDAEVMSNSFEEAGLVELEFAEPYTWASAFENYQPAKFDRVWLSREWVTNVSNDHIKGPCSSGDNKLIAKYNKEVSDHCPTTFEVKI
jgi:endonuclease/exonuclease/phosphatase family metal-dependent hydrolase